MRKLTLTEWAQVGEVVGMVAVVISLVIVVFSIQQNTSAMQSANVNSVFERHAELQDHFISDPTFAAVLAKKRSGDDHLSEVESIRWEKYQLNLMDLWAMLFRQNQEGLMPEGEWHGWNTYLTTAFTTGDERITSEWWARYVTGFGPDFWQHVNNSLVSQEGQAPG
jgi:hypothetical protein